MCKYTAANLLAFRIEQNSCDQHGIQQCDKPTRRPPTLLASPCSFRSTLFALLWRVCLPPSTTSLSMTRILRSPTPAADGSRPMSPTYHWHMHTMPPFTLPAPFLEPRAPQARRSILQVQQCSHCSSHSFRRRSRHLLSGLILLPRSDHLDCIQLHNARSRWWGADCRRHQTVVNS